MIVMIGVDSVPRVVRIPLGLIAPFPASAWQTH